MWTIILLEHILDKQEKVSASLQTDVNSSLICLHGVSLALE